MRARGAGWMLDASHNVDTNKTSTLRAAAAVVVLPQAGSTGFASKAQHSRDIESCAHDIVVFVKRLMTATAPTWRYMALP